MEGSGGAIDSFEIALALRILTRKPKRSLQNLAGQLVGVAIPNFGRFVEE